MPRGFIVRLSAAGFGFAALGLLAVREAGPRRLLLSVQVRAEGAFKVFYDLGGGYETGSSRLPVEPSEMVQVLRFPLPEGALRVRVHLEEGTGSVDLRRLCVKRGEEEDCLGRDEMFPLLRPVQDLEPLQRRPRVVRIVPAGERPAFECDLTPLLPRPWLRLLAAGAAVLLLAWADLWFLCAKRLAEALVLLARWIAHRRYGVAALLFVLLVAFELHGSSLAMWDAYLTDRTAEYRRPLLLGVARQIRSDEWAIQTPSTLGQRNVHGSFFPVVNPNIRSDGQNMLVHHIAPVFDLTVSARPFHWGYLLLGNAHGLSWWWWSRLLLLFLLSYEMAALLTGSGGPLALLAGAWIAFAPAVQWGYSLCHTDLLIACQAMIVCSWAYTRATSFRRRTALAAGFFLSALLFLLTVYPPHQVPLGYLALVLAIVFLWGSRVWRRLESRDYAVLLALLGFVAFTLGLFLRQSFDELRVLSDTVFPGQRRAGGGDVTVFELQRSLISWLLPFVYPPFSNPSELAGFMNLLPAVLLTLPGALRREQSRRGLVLALVAFTAVTLAWLLVPWPGWLARVTLLDRVPTFRMQPVFELGGLYLSIWAVGIAMRGGLVRAPIAWIAASGVAALQVASAYFSPMAGYLGPVRLVLTVTLFAVLNVAFLLGRVRPFALLLAAYIVTSGLSVNPLARGLSPLYDKAVTRRIQTVEARDPGRLWAARGRGFYGNLLVAAGVRSMSGSHHYPDLGLWHRLDPERRQERIYNRHAIVGLEVVKGATEFELTEEPATVTLRISLRELAAIGIKYLFSVGSVAEDDAVKLRTLSHEPSDDIFIYELLAPS